MRQRDTADVVSAGVDRRRPPLRRGIGTALLLLCLALPAAAQPGGPSTQPYANGCCLCRIRQADGRMADKACLDAQSYDSCAAACRKLDSTTLVYGANATCAQGCRRDSLRR